VLAILDRLSDPLDPEQLMYELYLKAKIECAEEAIARRELVSQEEAVRQSQEWFE
jgi:cytidylate kinase